MRQALGSASTGRVIYFGKLGNAYHPKSRIYCKIFVFGVGGKPIHRNFPAVYPGHSGNRTA